MIEEEDDVGAPASPERVQAFTPEQMVKCERCSRANGPTRTNCIYCGTPLPVTEASAALQMPTLRRLDKGEQGFNSIFLPDANLRLNEEGFREAAAVLRMDASVLRKILSLNQPLPLARAASFDEAALIQRRLGAFGMDILMVADEDLAVEIKPPKRVRAFKFTDEHLIGYEMGSVEGLREAWSEIILFVTGRLVVQSVEIEEKRGRRDDKEIVNARETSADDAVLDIYTVHLDGGWRVSANGFNYSCLGKKMRILAAENFTKLTEELRALAPAAEYDDFYWQARHALASVWPFDQRTQSSGVRRKGIARYNVAEVTTSDNETQFTRYSRLRQYLKLRGANLKETQES
ncbi:MAG: hypothetical protein WCB68_15850 [Pyrinomonadaceae bacterium]